MFHPKRPRSRCSSFWTTLGSCKGSQMHRWVLRWIGVVALATALWGFYCLRRLFDLSGAASANSRNAPPAEAAIWARRGYVALWIFIGCFVLALVVELIDRINEYQ